MLLQAHILGGPVPSSPQTVEVVREVIKEVTLVKEVPVLVEVVKEIPVQHLREDSVIGELDLSHRQIDHIGAMLLAHLLPIASSVVFLK